MNKRLSIYLALALAIVISACSSGKDSVESAVDMETEDYLVTIKTDLGEMKAVLHDLTPKHKANFVKLAEDGTFDSLLFHRVIPGFMIQGGDPNSKTANASAQLGSGSLGYRISAEFTPALFHRKGALAAARTGGPGNPDKESSASQFYLVQGQVLPLDQVKVNQASLSRAVGTIMRQTPNDTLATQLRTAFNEGGQPGYINKCIELEDEIVEKTGITFVMPQEQVDVYTTEGGTPNLDGEYTVYGQVIDGMDVIDKIAAVQTAPGDRPVSDVRMYISVEKMKRSEIASKYGYTDFK